MSSYKDLFKKSAYCNLCDNFFNYNLDDEIDEVVSNSFYNGEIWGEPRKLEYYSTYVICPHCNTKMHVGNYEHDLLADNYKEWLKTHAYVFEEPEYSKRIKCS